MAYAEWGPEHDALPPLVTDENSGEPVVFDAICLGTGLKECVTSGLLSRSGKKVLHLDRNDYYGGTTASLTLKEMYQLHRNDGSLASGHGREKDWCIDLIPKLLMATGKLIKVLIYTKVHRYVEFKQIEGSFVYKAEKGSYRVSKVPSNDKEAIQSDLMGLFEKRRFKNFLIFVENFDEKNPQTWMNYDPKRMTMGELMKQWSLSDSTVDFTGHAIALHRDNSYLDEPYILTVKRMKLYSSSLMQYGGGSPYLYPMYGLGELPQGFARLSAVYGGTYMLRAPVEKILMKDGVFQGVVVDGKVAKASQCASDPSYVPDRVKPVYKVARAIVILNHPPVCLKNPVESCQIIIPNNQVGRQSDIYVCCVGYKNETAPKGYYSAIVSTTVETANPENELRPGLDLLGPAIDVFYTVSDYVEPLDDGKQSQIYVSSSYDPTTHFETTCLDIVNVFRAMTGSDLDFDNLPATTDDDE